VGGAGEWGEQGEKRSRGGEGEKGREVICMYGAFVQGNRQ